jgi:uncharacterized membrane protein
MGILYILAGLNHFIAPEFYLKIMPPYMGWHKELVLVSGLIEIGLGALLFLPQYRKIAAWGIIVLLIAVFPANIYLAQTDGAALGVSALAAWVRLPIQLLLILWAWWYTRGDATSKSSTKPKSKAKKAR